MTTDDLAPLLEVQRRSYAAASEGLRRSWPEHDALDEAGMGALLREHRYGVLATSRADGRAHAAPVAFTVAEGAFWIATVAGLRLANLRAVPWASLVVMEGQRDEDEGPEAGAPHRALTAEGPVALHEEEALARAAERLASRWSTRHGGPPDWAAALVELRPARLFSHAARVAD